MAGLPSSPATSGCCGHGSGMRASSGSRTGSGRSRRGLPKLDRMVFHAELGMQGERVERLVALTGALVPFVPGADRDHGRACSPSRQGRSRHGHGRRVPRASGDHGRRTMPGPRARRRRWRQAIAEHYAPKGPEDACPKAPVEPCRGVWPTRSTRWPASFAKDIQADRLEGSVRVAPGRAWACCACCWKTGCACRCVPPSAPTLDGYGERLAAWCDRRVGGR